MLKYRVVSISVIETVKFSLFKVLGLNRSVRQKGFIVVLFHVNVGQRQTMNPVNLKIY